MKTLKYGIFAVAASAVALAPRAYAFHSGGVAECEGCHTMHNTRGSGRSIPLSRGEGNGAKFLLQGTDQSSTCLNCHNAADTAPSSYHISTDDSMLAPGKPPVEMTPGGDFAWLKKSYNWADRSGPAFTDGAGHGHNIVALDYGYTPDPTNTIAPGGTYPAAALGCTSCHDPHNAYRRLADGTLTDRSKTNSLPIAGSGSYNTSAAPIAGKTAVGVYRILGGVGYLPKSVAVDFGTGYAFNAGAPVAVAPSSYNRSEGITQTHVAYGSGMSEWCANCHSAMWQDATMTGGGFDGQAGHRHPAGNNAHFTAAVVDNYNKYVSSGIMTNADPTKAYSTLAPFETGDTYASITNLQKLAVIDDSVDGHATPTSNVMCLSCHRAHASGFEFGTRFFLENEFMTYSDSSGNAIYDNTAGGNNRNLGLNAAEQQAAYYGRPASVFGPNARNYCNKCHAKD